MEFLATLLVTPDCGYNLDTPVEAERKTCHSSAQNTRLREPGLVCSKPVLHHHRG